MKKTMRSLQKGRSMLEVIAVIAVMGILLIAGMIGFKILLDYLKHKETIEQITTISMRHKASRLNVKTQTKGYIPMDQVYPEGNNCANGTNTKCVTTPEGNEVRLFNIGENNSFMVLVSSLKQTTCEELAMMGGYEFVFTPSEIPSSTNNILNEISEIIQGNDNRNQEVFSFSDVGIFGAEGKTIALTAEYIKKNPTVLKKFCDPNLPLLGFVYTPDEDCNYFYDGECHNCPRVPGQDIVEDSIGECCPQAVLDNEANCGLCNGCGTTESGTIKKCLEAEQRCVECIDNPDCPAGNFCSNNKCVTCEPPFYKLTDGECTCVGPEQLRPTYTGEIGSECKEACNCKAGLMCIEGKCAECLIQPDCPGNVPCDNGQCRCDDDEHPCPPGQICCNETCCPAGQFCNDGVCSNCETNDQCGENRICCNGVCCAEEAASCCNGQCCNNDCTEVDGQKICGGCDENEDCPDNEYCDTTEHVCKPCLNEALKICEESVTENFNTKCYTKKHLNCLDETDTKDVSELIPLTPNINTPICANGANETDATCNACTSTTECQELKGKKDGNRTLLKTNRSTKVDGVLFEDFVCRRGHSGADAQYNGSCGPCIDNTDCEDNVPCLESGKCGCETDSDCSFKCDGKTTCDTGKKDCACTSPLTKDGAGNCVCPTSSDEFWRLKDDNDGNAQYACCPEGELPSNGECYPKCTNETPINNVKIFVDHSYSTIVGSTKIAENIENARKLIRRLISNVGRTISVSESNEYTESDALTVTRTIGGNSITFTAFNCGDNGHTCFANPNEDNGAIPAPSEGTLTFILSDGILPEATTKNLDSDYTYVFANEETSWEGMKEEHIIHFENLNSDQLEENISYVISTSICMSIEDISDQLHTGCNSDENP